MQYNPSFAGEAGAGRLSSVATHNNLLSGRSDRRSWGPYQNTFGIYTSYDQFIPALGTGIGITTGYEGIRNNYQNVDNGFISLAVAPKISIKGKYTLSPSLNISYGMAELDYVNTSSYNLPDDKLIESVRMTGSKAGLLFNANKYYIGYSVSLVNHYNYKNEKGDKISYRNTEGFKSWLQMGYTFQRSSESKFSFTPQLVFSISEKRYSGDNVIQLHAINLNFRYKQFIAGFNNTGIQLGFQNERLRLMFSSGFGILSPWEGAYAFRTRPYYDRPLNGNLSFRYIFKNTDKPGGGEQQVLRLKRLRDWFL